MYVLVRFVVLCFVQLAEIRTVCGRLNRACKCIQGSDGFAAVLQRLLIVGNAMNEGTRRSCFV